MASTVLNVFRYVGGVYVLKVIKTSLGSSYSFIFIGQCLSTYTYIWVKFLRRFAYVIWHLAYGIWFEKRLMHLLYT